MCFESLLSSTFCPSSNCFFEAEAGFEAMVSLMKDWYSRAISLLKEPRTYPQYLKGLVFSCRSDKLWGDHLCSCSLMAICWRECCWYYCPNTLICSPYHFLFDYEGEKCGGYSPEQKDDRYLFGVERVNNVQVQGSIHIFLIHLLQSLQMGLLLFQFICLNFLGDNSQPEENFEDFSPFAERICCFCSMIFLMDLWLMSFGFWIEYYPVQIF